MKNHLLLLFFLGILFTGPGVRASGIDSLRSSLKTEKHDSSNVNTLNALAKEYSDIGTYDSAAAIARRALRLSEVISYPKGRAAAYNILGIVSREEGGYQEAIDLYTKALYIYDDLHDMVGKAKVLGNIGLVYYNQANYPKTLDYFFQSQKMYETLAMKRDVAIGFGNIGIVYKEQGDYQKALDYYQKALKIDEELHDEESMPYHLGNIGLVYSDLADASKGPADTTDLRLSLDYYFRAVRLDEKLGNKSGVARHLGNIGNVYCIQANHMEGSSAERTRLYNIALDYYFKTLKLREELGARNFVAVMLGNIGTLYLEQGRFKDAYDYLYRALALSDSIGSMNYVKSKYEALSELYAKSTVALPDSVGGKLLSMEAMRLRALYYHKRFIAIRDQLFSEENKKELVRKELNYQFAIKETATRTEQEKKDARANLILYSVCAFLILVLLFAVILYRGYKEKKKANELIMFQKRMVEEKQKEIIDSIQYAKRIQRSLMPTEKHIERTLKRMSKK